MSVHEHLTEFAGLPVADFTPDTEAADLPDAGPVAWRVSSRFEEATFEEVFGRFVELVDTTRLTALIIGYWNMSFDDMESGPVGPLLAAAGRFPRLRSLFLGDIVGEETEISWIDHSDITPLLTAFPELESFEVRGSQGLMMSPIKSTALKTLRFESGGLPAGVVQAVGASELPALERLDLWLGEENYGGNATVADLAPILGGERLPALRQLGLEDSVIQDEVAGAVAGAPIVARLESLSLAMGVLTDQGAEALLSGQPLTHLKKLDLHHHFLSDDMMERVRAALPGVEVDLDEQEEPEDGDWFYIAVSE